MKSIKEEIREQIPKLLGIKDIDEKVFDYLDRQLTTIWVLGQIHGVNSVRLSVWGMGYDNDDTARMVRKFTCKQINKLKEPLEIERRLPLEEGFSDTDNLYKMLNMTTEEYLK